MESQTRLAGAPARELFDPAPGLAYLDAATYGLPPRPTVAALERALHRWQAGTADWVNEWDREGEPCRASFADLIGGAANDVALVPTVSVGVGLVAASLPEGCEVVVPEEEFTSLLYPFLAAEGARGARVRQVPFGSLAEAIRPGTGLVAFSQTRSQSGESAPLGEIVEAAGRVGARVFVDATHAVPFVPVAPHLTGVDYLVCHGYKHLLCPRGVGFLWVRPERQGDLVPWFANWRAAVPAYARNYGGSLDDLAPGAARFDVSLAWQAWAGARPSLDLLVGWRRDGTLDAVWDLSRRLAAGLGLPAPTSTIVSAAVADAEGVERSLAEAGVRCAARGGRIRLAPHVWNTAEEIDRAVAAVGPFLG